MSHILWSRNLLKSKSCRTFKTSHSLEEFGGKLYLENICIYINMVCIYIYTYTSHQFSIMTAPRWTYFTLVLIIPLQLEGTAWGIIAFFKKTWGVEREKQPGSNFSTIGRLNHRISSRIWSTFWRVMMNTLAVRMKKRQPPGLCDNSQGYSQGGCGYQPGWSQCDLKLEIATKRVNTSFYHLVFFFALEFQSLGRRIFPEFEF